MQTTKYLLHTILFLVIILLLASCRTAGLYTTNPKGKGTFAGTEIRLTKTDSFYIKSWTDNYTHYVDDKGNRIFKEDYRYRGYGTYKCLKDSMELTFFNEDSITVNLDIRKSDSLVNIELYILDEEGNVFIPNVDILDQSGNRIVSTIVQMKDTFNFSISKWKNPSHINLNGFGVNVRNPNIEIAYLESGQYSLKRKTYNGYFAKGVTQKIWFRRVPTGIRYQLNKKKKYLPKKWGWSWINKFYRDY